ILKNAEPFWNNNKTLKVVKMWHNLRRQPISYDEWEKGLRRFASIPPEKRQNNSTFLLAKKIANNKDTFFGNAIEHINSFLPQYNLKHKSTVYITTNISASAFAISSIEDHVVINISNPYWQGDYTSILNAIVHELFHTGYNTNQVFRTEVDITNSAYHNLLTGLQNEGMATYVAYTAQSMFPAPVEMDFKLLQKLSEVKKRLKLLNKLFSRAESLSPEELRRESWKTGVEERAYYVVGGYMAKTIDEKSGRDKLVETIITGPRYFIDTYNSLAKEGMEVYQLREPAKLTVFQHLRKAAVEKDYRLAEKLIKDIQENKEQADNTTEYTLNFAGSALQHHGNIELAFEVFQLSKHLFPNSIGPLYGLADIHLKRDETKKAIVRYEEIADRDAFPLYAEKMLKELKGR
ncbi:MAG: DUF5700 domain-containing putative Zn-dependent protease, partial [Planctomycetota bacterium]